MHDPKEAVSEGTPQKPPASDLRYQSLLERIPGIVYVAECGPEGKGRWSYVSPQIERLLGFSPTEWMANDASWINQIHPEDRDQAVASKWSISENGGGLAAEYRMFTRDRRMVWIRDEAVRLPARQNRPVLMEGVLFDITESKVAQLALRHLEERLSTTLNNAPIILCAIDEQGIFTLSEGKALAGLQLKPGEVVGRSIFDVYRDYPTVLTNARRALSGEEFTSRGELASLGVTYEVAWSPQRDASGRAIGAIGVITDISDRHRMEQALQQSRERYARIIRSSPDWITLQSLPDGHYIDANDSFVRITGYSREDVLGKTAREINIATDTDWFKEMASEPAAVETVRDREFAFRTKGGERRAGTAFATRVEVNGQPCLLSIVRDITEQKRAEEELRKNEQQIRAMQKMEAVGRLAGGVAHDFNNLLMIISGQLQLLRRHLENDPGSLSAIQHAQKAADRAAALTRQLLAFGRMQTLLPQVLNLNTLIDDIQNLITPLVGPHIQLRLSLEPDLGTIKADLGQMEQVILNLVVNARDAMPGGGCLTIATLNVEADAEFATSHPLVSPGAYTVLEVSDTGMGMDSETQSRIFEPFFTTKEKGRGTGLGLASVYGIVKQSGGYILVESAPSAGTTFQIYLPRLADTASPGESYEPSDEAPAGAETILLVEDEPEVRDVARQFLEYSGYKVVEAGSGEEAVEIARNYPLRIALLLTDVMMPEITGKELAKRISEMRPETRIAYMSGFSAEDLSEPKAFNGSVLSKPFTLESLTRFVRKTIDGR